jgi:hypothetical protein
LQIQGQSERWLETRRKIMKNQGFSRFWHRFRGVQETLSGFWAPAPDRRRRPSRDTAIRFLQSGLSRHAKKPCRGFIEMRKA